MRPFMILCVFSALACGDDDGSEAVRRGVGAACAADTDCTEEGQMCLTEFKGGMCGIADCTASSECPSGSVCVEDPALTRNYCLLACEDKPECNVHRPVGDDEASCNSTLNAIDADDGGIDTKVCRPPNA